MPAIDSTYVTYVGAAGALGGVALTIISQVMVGRMQRRHDRIIKLFDAKLEIFSTFSTALAVLGRMSADKIIAEKILEESTIEYESLEANQERVGQRVKEFAHIANMSAEQVSQAREAVDSFEKAKTARVEFITKVTKRKEELEQKINEAVDAQARIAELAPRVSLIAEEATQHEISLVLQMINAGHALESKDFRGFERSARRELGVRHSRVMGKINKARRWLRMKRIRAKT